MTPSSQQRLRLERFTAFGLRGNPFQIMPPSEVPRLYVPWPSGMGPRAGELARSVEPLTQIMGPSGWGKSTLLAAIEDELRQADLPVRCVYLPPESAGRLALPAAECRVLLVDEAQRLAPRSLRELVRWADDGRRLIASTHADLTWAARHPVVTIRLPELDAHRLHALFARRIAWAGGDPARISLAPAAAEWLVRHGQGHLRVIEAVLYEVFQTLAPAEAVVIDLPHLEPWRAWIDARAAEALRQARQAHR